MADSLREIVESGELLDLRKDTNLLIDDGELKCLRFTVANVLADVAEIISNGGA